ncbi:hypothetical protein AOLI_G00170400 [Acnodon oligacanthus]
MSFSSRLLWIYSAATCHTSATQESVVRCRDLLSSLDVLLQSGHTSLLVYVCRTCVPVSGVCTFSSELTKVVRINSGMLRDSSQRVGCPWRCLQRAHAYVFRSGVFGML